MLSGQAAYADSKSLDRLGWGGGMGYIFLFLIGFGLAVTGGVTIIAYLNFLPAGIGWADYFAFIAGRVECYFLPAGVIIIGLVISRYPKHF